MGMLQDQDNLFAEASEPAAHAPAAAEAEAEAAAADAVSQHASAVFSYSPDNVLQVLQKCSLDSLMQPAMGASMPAESACFASQIGYMLSQEDVVGVVKVCGGDTTTAAAHAQVVQANEAARVHLEGNKPTASASPATAATAVPTPTAIAAPAATKAQTGSGTPLAICPWMAPLDGVQDEGAKHKALLIVNDLMSRVEVDGALRTALDSLVELVSNIKVDSTWHGVSISRAEEARLLVDTIRAHAAGPTEQDDTANGEAEDPTTSNPSATDANLKPPRDLPVFDEDQDLPAGLDPRDMLPQLVKDNTGLLWYNLAVQKAGTYTSQLVCVLSELAQQRGRQTRGQVV